MLPPSICRLSLLTLLSLLALALLPALTALTAAQSSLPFRSYLPVVAQGNRCPLVEQRTLAVVGGTRMWPSRDLSADIHLINTDASGFRRLTNSPSFGESSLSWSPDGRQIAFLTDETASTIEVINHDGTGRKTIFDPFGQGLLTSVSEIEWSPDGRRFVLSAGFVDQQGQGWSDIFVLDLSSSELTRLTYDENEDRYPTWSLGGDKILYSSHNPTRGDYDIKLRIINADGSSQGVAYETQIRGDMPDWSPAAEQFAFSQDGHLRVIDGDGSNPRHFSTENISGEYLVDWSPDGQYIANSYFSGLIAIHEAYGDAFWLVQQPIGYSLWQPAWRPCR